MKMIKRVNIDDLNLLNNNQYDFFVAFCGFEKRCLSVVQNISSETIEKGIVFINNEVFSESRENLQAFNDFLGNKAIIKEIDIFNPLEVADSFIDEIVNECKQSEAPRLLVDITSFTHEALLIFLAICNQFLNGAQIDYAYSNASIYASENNDCEERWLSRGIKEVRSILGYAGDIKPLNKTVMIMMVGYECERACQVIDSVSPEELIITYNDANGSTDQTNGNASLIHANLLKDLAAYYQNVEKYMIPSNDPFETAKELETVISTIEPDVNIIIAPMNNKLATFGAGLVALKRPEIQLCYAPAIYYNTSSYSIRGDSCYLFSLNEKLENI